MVVVAGSVSRFSVVPPIVADALALAVNVPATLLLIVRVQVLLFVAASKAPHVVVPGVLGAG